ncbi:MAG TPA: hypothetical protein VL860_12235, partial [Planctomycetota bacterium]|nr:hypothetical protein [Planctomycetota bacterium]
MRLRCRPGWMACFVLLLTALPLAAATYTVTPEDALGPAVEKLQPGDELVLSAGTYPAVALEIKGRLGTADKPFTLRGAAGQRAILEGSHKKRMILVDGCSFWRFENLEITGKNGWDAFKFFGVNSDIVVESCYLHDLGGGAINCSGIDKMTRLTVRHCHISGTGGNGEGMYLGYQDGNGKSVYDSLFEYNLIHDTGGDQGDGIELNSGGLGNTIRFNVIFNTNYPCIFVENRKAGKPNLVQGNICWNSNNEGIQINGNAKVVDNLVVGAKNSYEISSRGVTLENNQIYNQGELKPAELLQRGLAMIRKNKEGTAAAQALTLDGDGFHPILAGRRLAESDSGKGDVAILAGSIECGGEQNPDEVATIRVQAIERILPLLKLHPNQVTNIGVDHILTPVQLRGGSWDGLDLALIGSGEKKTIAWETLPPDTLGNLILLLARSGTQKVAPADRLAAILCYCVGQWGYQINGQLGVLAKEDPTQV